MFDAYSHLPRKSNAWVTLDFTMGLGRAVFRDFMLRPEFTGEEACWLFEGANI